MIVNVIVRLAEAAEHLLKQRVSFDMRVAAEFYKPSEGSSALRSAAVVCHVM
jgi:hypothetical protein